MDSLLSELDFLIKKLRSKEPLPAEQGDAIRERIKQLRKALHGRKAVLTITFNGISEISGVIDTNNYVVSDAFYFRYETRKVSHIPTRAGIKTVEKTTKETIVCYPADIELTDQE